jgi:putative component of membrane protein insertase Oxa1/YidC/SpoIIIJ protein YidD
MVEIDRHTTAACRFAPTTRTAANTIANRPKPRVPKIFSVGRVAHCLPLGCGFGSFIPGRASPRLALM